MNGRALAALLGLVGALALATLYAFWPVATPTELVLRCETGAEGTLEARWPGGAVSADLAGACAASTLALPGHPGNVAVTLTARSGEAEAELVLEPTVHLVAGPADRYAVISVKSRPTLALYHDSL